MFKNSVSKVSKALITLTLVAAVLVPLTAVFAVDSRPTGSTIVNTDGSTTLFPILQTAKYQFPAAFPGKSIELDSGQGTGSGHGRSALLSQVPIASGNGGPNEPIDVALASSACGTGDQFTVTAANFTEGTLTKTTTASPLTCLQLTDVLIAKDAITILIPQSRVACVAASTTTYVNKNMILAIWGGKTYTGETTAVSGTAGTVNHTWQEFWSACPADPLVPISRIIGSGTRQSFLDLSGVVAADEQAAITATGLSRWTSNAEIENDISNNPNHIAYTGLAFDNTKTSQMSVKFPPAAAIAPSDAAVADSSYPMSRVLHYYYNPTGAKQATIDLANWLLTSGAQGNIEKEGFVSIQKSTNPVVPGAQAPAPDWDVNADHNGNILDVTSIGAFFGQTGPASADPSFPNIRGWVRADVNFDANVNILDITTFGPKFGSSW
jgi:ABC-type phosphate transport system substrate-binding protein